VRHTHRRPAEQVAAGTTGPPRTLSGLGGLQRAAGNRAVGQLLGPPVPVQRCGCGGATGSTSVQRFGWGFLGDLASAISGLVGGDEADPLQQKSGPATCSEQPTWKPEVSIPTDIRADTALDFSQQIKRALGGNPHMQPSFTWSPDVDDKGRITKVNMTISTKIVRPRFAGGRPTDQERALIVRLEGLIKAHEERHRDIARRFAQRALCAAIGKDGNSYEKAINTVLCEMNKAQEALDKTEGTVRWTLDPTGSRVVDVGLAPEPSASYPC
jgi:Bacterial protein of unknown function (DUF922)